MEKLNKEFLQTVRNKNEYRATVLQSLSSTLELNSYIFRRDNKWYRLENWNPPNSGLIREWQAVGTDFIPKKSYTKQLNAENSKIVIDIEEFYKKTDLGNIMQASFSIDGETLLLITELDGVYDVVIIEKVGLKILNIIKNISIETLPVFLGNDILFCRNDDFGRPDKLYLLNSYDHEEHLIYEEVDKSYRLKIVPVRGLADTCMIKSANFKEGKIFIFDGSTKKSKFDILINTKQGEHLPAVFSLIDILGKLYFVRVHRDLEGSYLVFTSIYSKEFVKIRIENKAQVRSIDVFGCNLILRGGSNLEHTHILLKNLSDSPLVFKEILINFSKETYIYENSYSKNQIIFLEKNIFSENVISYDIDSETIKKEFVKSFFQDDYNSEFNYKLIWTKEDENGFRIPISLLWSGKNELPKNKECVCFVYGAYGKDDRIKFDPTILSIVKSGFLYAVIHVRGGGFLGGEWYRSGKGLNKKNSIDDFIKGVNYLVNEKIVDDKKVGLISSSAGAIIAGATLNEYPNLFKSILLFSPFIDLYGTLMKKVDPLSSTEVGEWGDISDPCVREYIKEYSPMQNTEKISHSKTTVISLLGKKDQYIDNTSVISWSEKLNMCGVTSIVFTNDNAGHGGIYHSDKTQLAEIISYFLSEINN